MSLDADHAGCEQRLEQDDFSVRVGGSTGGDAAADDPDGASAAWTTAGRGRGHVRSELFVSRQAVRDDLFADGPHSQVVDVLGKIEERLHSICVANAVVSFHDVTGEIQPSPVHLDARSNRFGQSVGDRVEPSGAASTQTHQRACGLATEHQCRVCRTHRATPGMKRERRGGESIDTLEEPLQHADVEKVAALLAADRECRQLDGGGNTVVFVKELGDRTIERGGGHGRPRSVIALAQLRLGGSHR
ncbi:MAG: hypothetical protein WCC60_14890 [Ilumatobacteraceae bacterium]